MWKLTDLYFSSSRWRSYPFSLVLVMLGPCYYNWSFLRKTVRRACKCFHLFQSYHLSLPSKALGLFLNHLLRTVCVCTAIYQDWCNRSYSKCFSSEKGLFFTPCGSYCWVFLQFRYTEHFLFSCRAWNGSILIIYLVHPSKFLKNGFTKYTHFYDYQVTDRNIFLLRKKESRNQEIIFRDMMNLIT